jgi:hypothetical protein
MEPWAIWFFVIVFVIIPLINCIVSGILEIIEKRNYNPNNYEYDPMDFIDYD